MLFAGASLLAQAEAIEVYPERGQVLEGPFEVVAPQAPLSTLEMVGPLAMRVPATCLAGSSIALVIPDEGDAEDMEIVGLDAQFSKSHVSLTPDGNQVAHMVCPPTAGGQPGLNIRTGEATGFIPFFERGEAVVIDAKTTAPDEVTLIGYNLDGPTILHFAGTSLNVRPNPLPENELQAVSYPIPDVQMTGDLLVEIDGVRSGPFTIDVLGDAVFVFEPRWWYHDDRHLQVQTDHGRFPLLEGRATGGVARGKNEAVTLLSAPPGAKPYPVYFGLSLGRNRIPVELSPRSTIAVLVWAQMRLPANPRVHVDLYTQLLELPEVYEAAEALVRSQEMDPTTLTRSTHDGDLVRRLEAAIFSGQSLRERF